LDTQSTDIQSNEIVVQVNSNQVDTIAGGIADKLILVLKMAKEADSRKHLLAGLALVNNANNFETYIQPLVVTNWLTMTIPDKPTSPKQQYLTTLKGRLILGFLKHKTK
jgi:ATP-dependent DNA helicase RecG